MLWDFLETRARSHLCVWMGVLLLVGISTIYCFVFGLWALGHVGYFPLVVANCYASESNVFYSRAENPDCFAQWRVDITANVKHEDGTTAIEIFYGKAALAEADAGSWVDCEYARAELNYWPIGQNYTCWFNPDEIVRYPTIPEVEEDDYNNYAWFHYYPGELDASVDFFTLGVSLLVLGSVSVITMCVLCV
ncbi:hypothetical protein Pelo_17321 [Pelomyxa schiedti]|nr:hypothetical protein Pelo_17321 [Pelomyxa schiedti]